MWGPVTRLQKSTTQEHTATEYQATTYRVYLKVHCSYYSVPTDTKQWDVGIWTQMV